MTLLASRFRSGSGVPACLGCGSAVSRRLRLRKATAQCFVKSRLAAGELLQAAEARVVRALLPSPS